MAWGDPDEGGDCSEVADRLAAGVTAIYCTQTAFAAVKEEGGEVVAWGDDYRGGEVYLVADRLAAGGVTAICSNIGAFAALREVD